MGERGRNLPLTRASEILLFCIISKIIPFRIEIVGIVDVSYRRLHLREAQVKLKKEQVLELAHEFLTIVKSENRDKTKSDDIRSITCGLGSGKPGGPNW